MAEAARDFDWRTRCAELPFGMTNRLEARNYFAWQAEMFRAWARGVVIDHGAGTGGLSAAMLDLGVARLIAIEPDPQLAALLRETFGARSDVQVMETTLEDYASCSDATQVDLIVSSNVLEHIEDDEGCLRTMFRIVRPGGAIGLYVPARQELFGSLDARVGHLRRYDRAGLAAKVTRAGFVVQRASYRNLVGVLPWLIAGRVLRRRTIGGGSIKLYDRIVLPVFRRIENHFDFRYGLNLVVIGKKPH
jgi:SAM-dependent methyltransferase